VGVAKLRQCASFQPAWSRVSGSPFEAIFRRSQQTYILRRGSAVVAMEVERARRSLLWRAHGSRAVDFVEDAVLSCGVRERWARCFDGGKMHTAGIKSTMETKECA
jgi:hypothetical protein